MQKSLLALCAVLALSFDASVLAQQSSSDGGEGFDSRDLTGVWVVQQPREYGRSLSPNRPPMTEWGRERFDAVRSSRGGQPWVNAYSPQPPDRMERFG